MNRDGKLDSSFGVGGFAVPQAGMQITQSMDAILLPSGEAFFVHNVLVNQGHPAVLLTKQTASGSMDTTFGQNGAKVFSLLANSYASTIAIQPDGKILIGGYIDTQNLATGYDFFVLRITARGDLDQTFGNNGLFTKDYAPPQSSVPSYDRVGGLIVQPDGAIIVSGMSDHYIAIPGRTNAYAVLTRLDANGGLDTTFGTGGTSMVPVGHNQTNSFDGVQPVVVRLGANGNVIAGLTVDVESQTSPGTFAAHAIVLRFLSNGTLDVAFSDDGMLDISLAYSATYPTHLSGIRELPNGAVLALTTDGLSRLTPDGIFDSTFGTAGRLLLGLDWNPNNFEVMPDNKIVVSGMYTRQLQPGVRFIGRLRRYWPDGTTDIRFGQSGRSNVEVTGHNIVLGRITAFENKYYVFGQIDITTQAAPFVSRFFATR